MDGSKADDIGMWTKKRIQKWYGRQKRLDTKYKHAHTHKHTRTWGPNHLN